MVQFYSAPVAQHASAIDTEWERDTIRDRGQAAGAVIGEGEGGQGLPGERWVSQCRRQDVRGEPTHRARRQGWVLWRPTRHNLKLSGYRVGALQCRNLDSV